MAAFDPERILELAQEVNEEWKRIDSIDGVARGEAEKIRREDSEHRCQHAEGCEAIVGPAFDARQVKKNKRVACAGVDVARLAVPQLHRLMDRRSSRRHYCPSLKRCGPHSCLARTNWDSTMLP